MPITPLPVFIAQLGKSLIQMTPRVAAAETAEAAKMAARARSLAPVRTGALRASITASPPSVQAGVVSVTVAAGGGTVDYAPFVERGTSRMAPQPFMRPAVDAGIPDLEKQLADDVAKLAAGR